MNISQPLAPAATAPSTPKVAFHKERLRAILYIGLLLSDCAAIRAGFSVGMTLRPPEWLMPLGFELGWVLMPIHIIVSIRTGSISLDALTRRSESLRRASAALLVSTSIVTLILFLQSAGDLVSRLAFISAILSTFGFVFLFRLVFHACFVAPVRGGLIAELLIVDGVPVTPGAHHVFDAAEAGFVPDMGNPEMLSRMAHLLAPYDRVIVSAVEDRRFAWSRLLKAFTVQGEIMLDQGDALGAIGISRYHGSDTAVVGRGPMSLGNRVKKRLMDLTVGTAAVIALAPLLIVIAIAIKFDSPGPVFFLQTRIGRGNRPFRIIKFRSMYANAADAEGRRSASRGDDRVTRVGRIIRMTSLDELPQIFNVLKGEMSIVGPRPHALGSMAGDKLFWEVTQRYWLRHMLKPGITGLAQIRGFRGATHAQSDLENRLQSDLEYIEGWRLWRDFTIIINTLRVIVHPHAY